MNVPELYNNPLDSDVKLIFSDGVEIFAHKLILRRCSSFIDSMLSRWCDGDNIAVLRLEGHSDNASALRDVIKCIYGVNVKYSEETIDAAFYLGSNLSMERLYNSVKITNENLKDVVNTCCRRRSVVLFDNIVKYIKIKVDLKSTYAATVLYGMLEGDIDDIKWFIMKFTECKPDSALLLTIDNSYKFTQEAYERLLVEIIPKTKYPSGDNFRKEISSLKQRESFLLHINNNLAYQK